MRAILEDNKWIWFDNITVHEEEVLWKEFSVSDPNAYVDPSQLGMWDGIFRKYNRAKKRMARPLLSMLRSVCSQYDLPLEILDKRDKWEYSTIDPELVTEDFLPGIKMDDHQIRAIRRACQAECGIINVPTGGGKGEVICGICKAIDCPTVIVADQRIVIDQLKARLELRQISPDIGLFYAGKRPSGQTIIVGSIQSLQSPPAPPELPDRKNFKSDEEYAKKAAKWDSMYKAYKTRKKNAKYLQDCVKNAEMVIVDECDKAAGTQFKNFFRHWFSGRRRYGLSGTPFDPAKLVANLTVQEHLGSVIAKETRQKLVEIGRIITCDYIMIGIGPFDGIKESSMYDIARNEHMVESPSFHKMIASICKKYKGDGTLVLVDREPLGHALVEAINRTGLTAHFIYGKTPKRRRDELLRSFERREFDVLIGGKIINRGLDLSGGCENLIIATGGKLQSEFEQKLGRALRLNKMGRSRVFDFFFRCNKHLYNHSKARLQVMVNLNYNTSVIFPGGRIDGAQLIQRRFQITKGYLNPKR